MARHYRSRQLARITLLAVIGSVLIVLPETPTAADTIDTGTVTATITVEAGVTITFTDATITLTGSPGDTPEDLAAVSMTVVSNSPTGYNVSVDPATDTFPGATSGDTINATDLEVRSSATGSTVTSYTHLTTGPLVIHNTTTPSAGAGDVITNDYRMTIPGDAEPDVYTGTITYTATVNP